MDTSAERLRAARKEKGFESAAEAARNFHWSVSTYSGHENGNRGLKQTAAQKYAKAFGVSPEWLLFGTGRGFRSRMAPVSRPDGFSEPEATPLSPEKYININSLVAKLDSDAHPSASPFVSGRDLPSLLIARGDTLIVNLQIAPRSGDIVVANQIDPITGAGVTLIRRMVGKHLVAETSDPLIEIGDTVSVFGRVDSVIRRMTRQN